MSSPPPSYLARHLQLGFNASDVAALIASIDASQQRASSPTTPSLPAELLLQILEHVRVDHILDWRLVSRGFRAAIDTRILFHHLRRTTLLAYLGPKHAPALEHLSEEEYARIHLLRAGFQEIAWDGAEGRPVWDADYAIFRMADEWFDAFSALDGATIYDGIGISHLDTRWRSLLDRLQLLTPEEGFGTLRWCIQLEHCVLDLAFPLERGRTPFCVAVDLHQRVIRVEWKPMLRQFLCTSRLLRRTLAQRAQPNTPYTFSHAEDCLRAVRRTRLHASLDPDSKRDRHIKWSLRLLPPLFGIAQQHPRLLLEDVEGEAVRMLLLLRREAGMSVCQLAYLAALRADFELMEQDMAGLERAFRDFKAHLAMPGFALSVQLPSTGPRRVARNPIAWSDELRAAIEEQVAKWKSQRSVIRDMGLLLGASNFALTLPEDGFEDLGSDF